MRALAMALAALALSGCLQGHRQQICTAEEGEALYPDVNFVMEPGAELTVERRTTQCRCSWSHAATVSPCTDVEEVEAALADAGAL